jgi:hypothetical protein
MTLEKTDGEIGVPQPFTVNVEKEKDDGNIRGNDSLSTTSTTSDTRLGKLRNNSFLCRCWDIVSWTPPRCRWDPENPPKFSMSLNLLFGFVGICLFMFKKGWRKRRGFLIEHKDPFRSFRWISEMTVKLLFNYQPLSTSISSSSL